MTYEEIYLLTPRGITKVNYHKAVRYMKDKFSIHSIAHAQSLLRTYKAINVGAASTCLYPGQTIAIGRGECFKVPVKEEIYSAENWLISPVLYQEVLDNFIADEIDN